MCTGAGAPLALATLLDPHRLRENPKGLGGFVETPLPNVPQTVPFHATAEGVAHRSRLLLDLLEHAPDVPFGVKAGPAEGDVWCMCGGTGRLSGAGLFLKTRPARSKVDPWHGQRKPPSQLSGSEACGPGWKRSVGEQPRCVQMLTTTRISGLIERWSLRA